MIAKATFFQFKTFLFLLLISSQGILFAQSPSSLLTVNSKTQIDYPDKIDFFNKLNSKSDFVAMYFAEFSEWETSLNENGCFSISLLGVNETWMPSYVEEFDDRVHYGGHFDGETGNLSIVDYGNKIYGSIELQGKYYQIFPLENREVLILESAESTQIHNCTESNSSIPFQPACSDPFDFCPATVRVLFLRTAEAQNRLNNEGFPIFGEFVDIMTGDINEALVNSGLANKRITSVFHPTVITQITEPTTAGNFFTANEIGSEIQMLRETYEADVVFIHVNAIDSASGYAMGTGVGANENLAYAIGEVFWDLKNGYNLAHELGHLFGGHHQPGVQGSNGCNAAHEMFREENNDGVITDQAFTAVWSGAGSRNYYKKHFSNPYVTWQGYPTGIVGQRANALFIDDHFCNIADFYPTLDFAVDINVTSNGDNLGCPSSYTLTANITTPGPGNPGQPNYEFEWLISRAPFFSIDNPGDYLGSGGSVIVDDPSNIRPDRYVKLTVTSNDGFDLSRTKFLHFCQTTDTAHIYDEIFRSTELNNSNLIIYPNPASIDSKIYIEGNLSEKVASIEVLNSQGTHIQNIQFDLGKKQDLYSLKNFKINGSNGLLFLLFKDRHGRRLKTEKIFVR